ncbi:DNA topoisomerase, partial [Dysosmobacter welbionis]
RLTGGHGHVGGVGDQHRPLHQGLPGAGVLQLRELPEHVGHLVAPLAAADVDHDVHIRPLGQLVLHHSLAGAEGPGHGGGAALGNGEQGVNDPLAGAQRPLGGIFVLVGPPDPDRPLLHHGQGHVLPLVSAQGGHGLLHGEGAAPDVRDGAAQIGGHHDLVEHHRRLRHGADHVAALHLRAGGDRGGEVPLLLPVQGRDLHAPGDVGAHLLHDLLQRPLDAVIDAFDHAGAQLHAHGSAGGDHLRPRSQAGGLLVHLDGGGVPLHRQNLADQPLGADADHVGHIGVRQARGHHQRSGYLHNLTAQTRSTFFHTSFAGRTSGANRRSQEIVPGKTRGFSSSPTVRQKKNIHHVRRSVYAVNNPRLSRLGRRPPVRAQAAGSGAEIPLGADRRGNSAQAGSPAGTSQGKQPKRRQRRKSGAVSRKAPGRQVRQHLLTGLARRCAHEARLRPKQGRKSQCHSGVSLFSSEDIRAHRSLNGLLDVVHTDAERALPAGDQDDGGPQLVLIPVQHVRQVLCQLLRQIDDAAVAALCQLPDGLPGLLGGGDGIRLQSQGPKAHDGLPAADHGDPIRCGHGAASLHIACPQAGADHRRVDAGGAAHQQDPQVRVLRLPCGQIAYQRGLAERHGLSARQIVPHRVVTELFKRRQGAALQGLCPCLRGVAETGGAVELPQARGPAGGGLCHRIRSEVSPLQQRAQEEVRP